jgi:NAD-dependent SIR2 family protein deacetylase
VSEDALKQAHRRSAHHREELLRSAVCGCFHCRRTFPPAEVSEWTDGGQTALCPRCGIDSVLGDASGLALDARFLGAMHERWFGR